MNLQQIFDKSVNHLLTQGCKSSEGTTCRYRSDKGACGIGGLFPDSLYKEAFDNDTDSSVGSLIASSYAFCFALESQGIDTSNDKTLELLDSLQNLHDKSTDGRFTMDIQNGACRIAKEFDLLYNPESKS